MKRTLWLRSETKRFEERVALTPVQARDLLDKGHRVVVERSVLRVFKDEEYLEAGCEMKASQSWITEAPPEATIFGLKELNTDDFSLPHRHIHFAHAYKAQDGADQFLGRFAEGEGKLFDLEYLTHSNGKRVAAFGVWAGFTGAALGLDLWINQLLKLDLNKRGPLSSYPSSDALVQTIKCHLADLDGVKPKVLIIGAKGRCGQGAQKFFKALNIEPTCWSSRDTLGKSNISEILDYDLLINCALMTKKATPWLSLDMLDGRQRLTTLSDISCDPTGPCNPLPLYPHATTMEKPAYYIKNKNFAVTAIDHLPSLLPRESSEDFANQLYPHLLNYMEGNIVHGPWERALNLFYKNLFNYHPGSGLDTVPTVFQ